MLASGSPVSGLGHEHWPLGLGLRLRRSIRVRRSRPWASVDHLPPVFPLSRVANMRSAHTPASVQAHCRATSLPCLALGTPGSSICCGVSFTLPPSCPPWLHGRYPLLRYYGDSDSCPAPSSTRTGLLDYRTCISGHSVSNHPMRPRLPALLLAPGGLGPRFAWLGYRRFFGLRSFLAVSSVA